ncbi:MAG: hypothetical protein EBT78_08075 [Betaproteobacteria bacterium]|nr:hypothetical protein [Betaproteobacteria bacterium]
MKKLDYVVTATARSGTAYMARLLSQVGIPCGHETIFGLGGKQVTEVRLKLLEEGKATTKEFEPNSLNRHYCEHITLSQCSTERRFANATLIDKYIDPLTIVADSSFMSAPFLTSPLLSDSKIIHVIRNPISVINSMVNFCGLFRSSQRNTKQNKFLDFISRHTNLAHTPNPYEVACCHWIDWNQKIIDSGKVSYTHRIEDPIEPLLDFLGKSGQSVSVDVPFNSRMLGNVGAPSFKLSQVRLEISLELINYSNTFGYDISNSF